MKTLSLGVFATLLLLACTNSGNEAGTEVSAGIGNECRPSDGREVWLRVAEPGPGDTNAIASCPAFTDGGLRVRLLNGHPLDDLEEKTYTDLPVRDCRDSATNCPALMATVRITAIGDWDVRGTYELFDSSGVAVDERTAFKAARCVLTPHCG